MTEHEHDDGLERYARALRQQSERSDSTLAAQTRARVVASARRPASTPRYALAAAVALAIVLAGGSSVWALYYGELPFFSRQVDAPLETPDPVAPAQARPSARVEAPASVASLEPSEALPAAPTRPAADAPALARAPREAERPLAREAAPEEIEPPVDPAERRAYDLAHAAHFEAHDWPRAIEAWRAYVRAYPAGRYVPEARFNIAIALVRAGHRAEARAALAPIADGTHGAYRRAEAAALLSALDPEEEPAGE